MRIQIDGEVFDLRMVAAEVRVEEHEVIQRVLAVQPSRLNDEYMETMFATQGKYLLVGRIGEKMFGGNAHRTCRSTSFGFRPALIPNTPLDKRENPPGCRFTGGTLYLDGTPVLPDPANPIPFENTSLTIGDTVKGKELNWVFLENQLVCSQVLLTNISAKDLETRGIT